MEMKLPKKLGILLTSIFLLVSCGYTLPVEVDTPLIDNFGSMIVDLHDQISKDNQPPIVAMSISAPSGNNGWDSATVLKTVWPFVALSGLLIAIASFFALDPRKNEWAEIAIQLEKHTRMYQNGLALEIEEEYRDD